MQVLARPIRVGIVAAAGAAALALTPAAATASAPETCFGYPATIVGTPNNDSLTGTAGNDVIVAGAGDDSVLGLGGNDLICGGTGKDQLNGGPGDDRIDGGKDSDANKFYGGLGDDELYGPGTDDWADYSRAFNGVHVDLQSGVATGEGTDRLIGIDTVVGSPYADTMLGDDLQNYFFPRRGDDTVDGRGGFDAIFYSSANGPVTVDLGARSASGADGNDTVAGIEAVVGSFNDDRLYGGPDVDFLVGTEGVDFIDGRGGNDVLAGDFDGEPAANDRVYGGAGSDFLLGLAGDDLLNGGPGAQDLAVYWYGRRTHADLRAHRVTGEGTDRLVGVEGVFGSPGPDVLIGSRGPDLLYGDERGDTLSGLGGDDFLDGGAGVDRVDGGKGSDYCLRGERRKSCEIRSTGVTLSSMRLDRLAAAASNTTTEQDDGDIVDYTEKPTCTTRTVSSLGPDGDVRRRRRRVASASPPGRVVPAAHRGFQPHGLLNLLGPLVTSRVAAGGIALGWQPTLYRYRRGSWRAFRTFPELTSTPGINGTTAWSNAGGAGVQRVSAVVPAGRYAWGATMRFGSDTTPAASIEPHLNFGGKGGRFQAFCRF